jgi:uncharacterized protein DUF5615
VDSRLRRSPPDRASAVPYGQAGENAMRFPRLAHRSAAAHKLHSTPQQDRMNLISGKGETSSRLPAFSLFLPGSCPNYRDRRTSPGAGDREVLAWAVRESRILLTFDKDFGELARASGLPATCGVVLFRIPMPKPGDVGQRLADLVTAREDWVGHFSVIEPGRVRLRPLA